MKNLTLAKHLRDTIARLESGAPYQWTHQGRCNLGHCFDSHWLEGADIHRMPFVAKGTGGPCEAYCPNSGVAVDKLIGAVLQLGVRLDDPGDFNA